ncbi:MAG TPA: sugar ABC transporter substrate-binding protein [Clostridiaceae bacterium]|nr:sugar ABC transporter substrate-binding protein [Clostridiaceae bacterium]
MKLANKKILAILLAVFMLISLAACGGTAPNKEKGNEKSAVNDSAEKPDKSSDSGKGLDKIAFIVADMANESQAFSSRMFQKYGKDYNFEVIILDAKGDVQAETQAVNNAVAQGVKALFVNPNDINAIVPALEAAKSAGVVVGLYSSDLPADKQSARDFFVGVNDNQAGEAAAQAFMDFFPDGATIVEIGGQSGHDAQIKRHDGFNNAIKDSKIQVIDYKATQQWSTEQAMAIMEDMITKHGDKIQGVFVHWDNGATGVIQAAKAANMEGLFIVGVDGNRAGFEQVRQGDQSVTIMQNFENMTKKSLELARKVIDGEKVEPLNFIPLDIVNIDNIDSFTPPEW